MQTDARARTSRLTRHDFRPRPGSIPRRLNHRLRAQARHHDVQKKPLSNADVVGFTNLCLDVRLRVPRLPKQNPGWREAFMQDFLTNPPTDSILEPGGVSNTLLAASRLGLEATVVGHIGTDKHGTFCQDCLHQEGVHYVALSAPNLSGVVRSHPLAHSTPLCLVIVDPMQQHRFCSSFQVTPGPLYLLPSCLSSVALEQIRTARALFINGYAFQEASGEVLRYVCEQAIDSGRTTFFDPGPFGSGLAHGSSEEKKALLDILQRSHVVLATEEEATSITGESDPIQSGHALMALSQGGTQWVVIKLGEKGSLFFQRGRKRVVHTAGFRVPVSDTVGCGDSFAAAVVYGYLQRQGERPEGVMELANAIGAITATRCGAGRNVADLSKVKTLLQQELRQHSAENGGSGVAAALELLKEAAQSIDTVQGIEFSST